MYPTPEFAAPIEPLTFTVSIVGSEARHEVDADSAIEASAVLGRALGQLKNGRVFVYGSDGTSLHAPVRNSEITADRMRPAGGADLRAASGSGASTFFAVVLFAFIPIGAIFVEVVQRSVRTPRIELPPLAAYS